MKVLILSERNLKEKEIENNPETLQNIVGGHIETSYICEEFQKQDIVTIINEEGKISITTIINEEGEIRDDFKNILRPEIAFINNNTKKITKIILGNCIFAGYNNDGEMTDLSPSQIETIEQELKYLTNIDAPGNEEIEVRCIIFNKQPEPKGVDWNYFDKFNYLNDTYFVSRGEGDTMATQIFTAVSKLVYNWYNDGDVYDNTYCLEGCCNDLSSYANWLYKYTKASAILEKIGTCYFKLEYEFLLKELVDTLFTDEYLAEMHKKAKVGSIYKCDGPFKFELDEE